MKYRINPKNGDKLSALGFGCMRFAKGEQEVEKQILSAIEQGVNYFDTAYIYPNSEVTLGRILSKGHRDKVKLATKMPPYLINKYEDFDKIFQTQLKRLQTDYIDYYLIHMLTSLPEWERLTGLDVNRWINEQKTNGRIRNIGFSYHGGQKEFVRIIDAYDWDFSMIQFNYLDETSQAGIHGLKYAAGKGIPVMIMEPLRGGMLANRLPKEAASVWEKATVKRSYAEWGLRWIWNHPEVYTVLSGMNTQEMIDENIRVASSAEPDSLSEQELELFARVKQVLTEKTKVTCTGCNYCMPCPKGVDIPLCFTCYNNMNFEKKGKALFNYIAYVGNHNASLCTKCGKCEKHCPQGIAIRKNLEDVAKEMERFPYKPLRFVAGKVMKRG